MNYERLPIIGKYYSRFKEKFYEINREMSDIANENISLRFKLKALKGEKIKVVFVCWRPSVWGSLKTVYESMKADNSFDVKIITIPNKVQLPKLGFNHELYESEGAEDFWKGEDVISGYNYETKEWFDLRLLKPDYVCFQRPYNVFRTGAEKSWVVSKYAKLFYVHYASNFIGNEVFEQSCPADFANDVSLWFNQNQMDYDLVKNHFKNIGNTSTKQFLTGFPRYDNLENYKDCDSVLWSLPKSKENFRVIWTPRWCTDEGNCHFFDYKDFLLDYCQSNSNVDFIFRPHPHAFQNWLATGEFNEENAKTYRQKFKDLKNANIDETGEYLSTFYSSDCMITDISSIVAEYFLTGNPIIYCHRTDCFNSFSRKLSEGFYWVHNWDELKKTLDMLRSGKDPLKEKRESLIKEIFYIPKEGSGNLIKDLIKTDFFES